MSVTLLKQQLQGGGFLLALLVPVAKLAALSGIFKMAKRYVLVEKDAYDRLTAKKSEHLAKISPF